MTANVKTEEYNAYYILRCAICDKTERWFKPVHGLEYVRQSFADAHRHSEALPAPSPAILDTLRTELLIRRGALERSLNGPVALPAAIAAIEWCKLNAIEAALAWIEAAERVVRADE